MKESKKENKERRPEISALTVARKINSQLRMTALKISGSCLSTGKKLKYFQTEVEFVFCSGGQPGRHFQRKKSKRAVVPEVRSNRLTHTCLFCLITG